MSPITFIMSPTGRLHILPTGGKQGWSFMTNAERFGGWIFWAVIVVILANGVVIQCCGDAPMAPVQPEPVDMTQVKFDMVLVMTSDASSPAIRDNEGIHVQQDSEFRLEPSWNALPGDARTTTTRLNFEPVPTGVIEPQTMPHNFTATGTGTLEVISNIIVYYGGEEYHFEDVDTITVFE